MELITKLALAILALIITGCSTSRTPAPTPVPIKETPIPHSQPATKHHSDMFNEDFPRCPDNMKEAKPSVREMERLMPKGTYSYKDFAKWSDVENAHTICIPDSINGGIS